MIEILAASTYYGRRTPGLVLLHRGAIVAHLTGRRARAELRAIGDRLVPKPPQTRMDA